MKERLAGERGQEELSLVLGGPLYQLLLRGGLMRPPLELLHRRVLASIVVTWVPLAVLTALTGVFVGGVSVPFLYDLDAHARFLLALPLLIGAELIIHGRLRTVVQQFRDRGLIAPEDEPAFDKTIARIVRIRNSIAAEVVIFVLSMTAGHWLWRSHMSLQVAAWYAIPVDGSVALTSAGYWYALVSLPISRFILFRWYFRLSLWYMFLFRVSRLRLRLNPLHPDRAGGLGFLGITVDALAPVLMAQSVFLSGLIANEIWHQNAALPEFKFMIAGVVVFLMLLALLPLTFFLPQMGSARRDALREYGLLASRYTDEFRHKWFQAAEPDGKKLLGTADIQSLADLANSYDVVNEMKALPFGRKAVVRLLILIALPLLPLSLTMVPFEQMVRTLINVLL